MHENEVQLKKPFAFLKNGALSTQPQEALLAYGHGVAGLLAELGGEHTFHPPAEALAFAMGINHAVIAESPEGDLAGYVKMSPWALDANGVQKMAESPEDFEAMGQGGLRPVCVEIGSLVVAAAHQGNNLGKWLASHMVEVAEDSYPGLPKIAVVTNDNVASLHVFTKLGWPVVSQQDAARIIGTDVLDGWPHPSTIFMYNGA